MKNNSLSSDETNNSKKAANKLNHFNELKRIHLIEGQIKGIKKMIEEKRPCEDILIQTKAIISAIRAVESAILEKHLHHCVKETFLSGDQELSEKKIKEILQLLKRD